MEFNHLTFQKLDSTNAEAIRLYQKGELTSPTVIYTHYQSNGKGYGDNYWESASGKNLIFSIACFPHFIEPSEQFILTQIISLSLWAVVTEVIPAKKISIKWPNDLYVGNKKIAGVLIQNFVKGNKIDFSVIGVGLNVNQKVFLSDAPNPTSLVIETGKVFDMEVLLKKILQHFAAYKNNLAALSLSGTIRSRYLENLYRFGKFHQFKDNESVFTAKITGINSFGQLMLLTEDGKKRIYGFKEIAFL